MNHKNQIITTIIILALLWVWLILSTRYQGWIIDSLRIGAGSIGLLFLPWYRLTMARFAFDDIDILEKFALSFAFSISIIPLLIFYLNLAGIPINERLVFITVVLVCGIGILREHKAKNTRSSAILE